MQFSVFWARNHRVEGVPNLRVGVRCKHHQIVIKLLESVCGMLAQCEVTKVLSRRKVGICSLQEVRWRCVSARLVEGKYSIYILF